MTCQGQISSPIITSLGKVPQPCSTEVPHLRISCTSTVHTTCDAAKLAAGEVAADRGQTEDLSMVSVREVEIWALVRDVPCGLLPEHLPVWLPSMAACMDVDTTYQEPMW